MHRPPQAPLPRTLVIALAEHAGRIVRVCGWAEDDPEVPAVVAVRDQTGRIPLTGTNEGAAPAPGSAVEVVGVVVVEPAGLSLLVVRLDVVGPARAEPPITDRSPLRERLDWRFLDLRRPAARLVFEIQTTAERAMREVWQEEGYLEIHSPKLRATANRSGRELFTVDYFGTKAFLAQSPQFHKQMAMAAGFDRVFEIGPVFRANPMATERHDTEFTSVDVEISWITSHEEVMAAQERWLARVIAAVAEIHGPEIERHFGVVVQTPTLPFPRVTMAEAYEVIHRMGWDGDTAAGDIDRDGELLLATDIKQRLGHDFVFITEYGAAARPFYHMRVEEGSPLTRGFDLLWKGLEVTTGAQREHRYEQLRAQADRRGIDQKAIQFYLDYFRFGCPPHGGFGLGLTRMLMALLDQDDVREVTYLHRGPHRLAP